jgi:transcription antitermination factor NusG
MEEEYRDVRQGEIVRVAHGPYTDESGKVDKEAIADAIRRMAAAMVEAPIVVPTDFPFERVDEETDN